MRPVLSPRRHPGARREELQRLVGDPVEVETDDGARLHVEVDPADRDGAPTVVLAHGYALSSDCWHFQRLALRGRYRLVLPDLRGHGRSTRGPAGPVAVARLADDLGQVVDAVAPTGPLVLVGHCLGGMAVMELAARRPDLLPRVEGVALVATGARALTAVDHGLPVLGHHLVRRAELALERAPGRGEAPERGRRPGADLEQRLVRHWSFAGPVAPELVRLAARMVAETPVDVVADLLPAFGGLDERAALSGLAGRPALVVTAERDLMTPPAHGREVAEALPGAEHVLVRGAGHLVMLEHPTVLTARLERLLARSGPAAARHEVVVPLARRPRRRSR
ncbi:alpha/beta fold hydrolase [Kineococcus radiotolerans]|uniref:Alpha/beta hydrolase fold n=1 Tax=Kineococcus radiotolerans (strain ATCC BAA-149 / DSM 14245 / SRS30216) TaxID=266940 RepID=A6W5X8_KINRD|nr:alpha/beta hydrolase [Kineococcus radiotolerans]ABS02217.1 alpha/beta hydrolase fold [Kineococcus radiotolerans SRS30216 = ATCC BAA-149]